MNLRSSFSSLAETTMFLSQDGTLYIWGEVLVGLEGHLTNEPGKPGRLDVEGLHGKDLISLAAGEYHTIALTKDNKLWAWGKNNSGQLGKKTVGCDASGPICLEDHFPGVNLVRVAAGGNCSVAISDEGKVYFWGYEAYGSFGIDMMGIGTHKAVQAPFDQFAIDVACGYTHTLVLTPSGEVYATGYNTNGCLGIGTTAHISQFTKIPTLKDVIKIACGSYQGLAITQSGQLYVWGWNHYSNCGVGHSNDILTPHLLMEDVEDVAAGWGHNLALLRSGELWSWGYNGSGQLGCGDKVARNTPVQITIPEVRIAGIGCGHDTCYIVTTHGEIYLWGRGKLGLLGPDLAGNVLSPVKPSYPIKWSVPLDTAILWTTIMVWLFLGRGDASSDFFVFPVEVLYHMTTILRFAKLVPTTSGCGKLQKLAK
jgi:hypothetical protein